MSETTQIFLTLNNVLYGLPGSVPANYNSSDRRFLKAKSSPTNLANDINSSPDAIGATIYVIDSKYQIKYATNLFYLSGFNFALKERAQVTNSLKEPILAFFDESVRVYTFQGVAPEAGSTDELNKSENFQHSSLVHLYNNHLRGTALAKNNNIAVLKVGNHVVYGYPLNLNSSLNSGQDKIATFSMNWAVAKHTLDLPGTVTQADLEDKTNVINIITKDVNLLIGKLDEFVEEYNFILAKPSSYLSKNYDIAKPEKLAKDIEALFTSLGDAGIIVQPDLFLRELQDVVSLYKNVKQTGRWYDMNYDPITKSSIGTVKQYLKDLQEGRGLTTAQYMQNRSGNYE